MTAILETDYEELGERIKEIMKDKGKSYSLRAICIKAGFTSHTDMSRHLNNQDGKYPLTIGMIRNIAKALKVSVERIRMTDVQMDLRELEFLLANGKNPTRALFLAEKINAVAIGSSEKYKSLSNLGKANYYLGRNDLAHKTWESAFEIAKKTDNLEWSYDVCKNICASLFVQKTYLKLKEFLLAEKRFFEGSLSKMAHYKHYMGLSEMNMGNSDLAMNLFLEGYDLYLAGGDQLAAGRMEMNIANRLFLGGKLAESKKWYIKARQKLSSDTIYYRSINNKDLARTLTCLGEKSFALQIVDDQLDEMKGLEEIYPEIAAKLFLLRADLSDDVNYSNKVFSLPGVSKELLYWASDISLKICLQKNDAESALKYYNHIKSYSISTFSDFKLWEGF